MSALRRCNNHGCLQVTWSDEAYISLDGCVNKQNHRDRAVRGTGGCPNFVLTKAKYPKKLLLSVFIHGGTGETHLRIFEPGQTLDGTGYYNHLRYRVIPWLCAVVGRDLAGQFLQQDGASIHTTDRVLTYLGGLFPNRVISLKANDRRIGTSFPPRSSDFTVCDYWFWAELKKGHSGTQCPEPFLSSKTKPWTPFKKLLLTDR